MRETSWPEVMQVENDKNRICKIQDGVGYSREKWKSALASKPVDPPSQNFVSKCLTTISMQT
jgi:hypothetical protein